MLKRKSICVALVIGLLTIPTCFAIAGSVEKDAPGGSAFKSYMDYRAISDTNSPQYHLQQMASTDSLGLRVLNGRYLVALGSYYTTEIGTPIDVKLSSGVVLPCILGDAKANCDTDSTNRQAPSNGNVVEFIVDTNQLNPLAKERGTLDALDAFAGDVVSITVHDTSDTEIMEVPDNTVEENLELPTDNGTIYTQEAPSETIETEVPENPEKPVSLENETVVYDGDNVTVYETEEETHVTEGLEDVQEALDMMPGDIITIGE